MKYYDSIYLDKEKDIVIDFYKDKDRYSYVLRTPNHHSGNLITNFAKVCQLDLSFDDKGLKIIKGEIPCFVNEDNERMYILKFSHKTIVVISDKGKIMRRSTVSAIAKTLMSQTKDTNLTVSQIFIRSYIEEKYRIKSDVHTHMNACLSPDTLIALGIKHQIKYPYYYVLKLNLKISTSQKKALLSQREKVAKKFINSNLVGKYKERRINDNTYINFADLILHNIKDAKYNLDQIRSSLAILKDGQAVFTNLEKLYLYRYVFTKGEESIKKIKYINIEKIPDKDIKEDLIKMLDDNNVEGYKNNTLLEDKLLWITRKYAYNGIKYVEISNTTLVKNNDEPIEFLRQAHRILPLAYKETGTTIRFLAALRRIPLTIIKDSVTPENYLRDNLDVLKAVAKDPYVVGSDFVGEEINEISDLKPVIQEIVAYCKENPYFTIRIHAGENDSVKNNVADSIKIIKESLAKGQKMPIVRLGHGLYTPNLKTAAGKKLISMIKENNVYLEFQLTSNVRLNNLNDIKHHPLKTYLNEGLRCLIGTDGPGTYGVDNLDEELALVNLLGINSNELMSIVKTEDEVIKLAKKGYECRKKAYDKLAKGRSIEETLKDEIKKNREAALSLNLKTTDKYLSKEVLAKQIKPFPIDKKAIVVVGGSFNTDKSANKLATLDLKMIDELLKNLSPKKYYFVIGHKLKGYEKYLLENHGAFEIYSIVPSDVTKSEKDHLIKSNIPLNVSTESLGMGTYKSFNYWLFERWPSIVIGIDGNSSAANLIQEAKNGKAKALIYVSNNSSVLSKKAESLKGYVNVYSNELDIKQMINKIKKFKGK